MIISRCYLTSYAISGSSIKSQILDLKTLPIFSPLKVSVSVNLSDLLSQLSNFSRARVKMFSTQSDAVEKLKMH